MGVWWCVFLKKEEFDTVPSQIEFPTQKIAVDVIIIDPPSGKRPPQMWTDRQGPCFVLFGTKMHSLSRGRDQRRG